MKNLLAESTQIGGLTPPSEAFSKNSELSANYAASNLEKFISNVVGALTVIASLFFIFYFVMGGLNWVTAGGDKGKVDKARDQMVQGVIGMIVIVISYGLLGVIGQFVGLDLLNPGRTFVQQLDPLNPPK